VLIVEDGMNLCHGCYDIGGGFCLYGQEQKIEVREVVTYMFKLFASPPKGHPVWLHPFGACAISALSRYVVVEIFTVPCEPVLYGFEQVSREVDLVGCGVSVLSDVVETLAQYRLVAGVGHAQGSFIEPCGGPGESVQEHAPVAVEVLLDRLAIIKALFDGVQESVSGEWFIHGLWQ
jgi:hypothetical protein